MLLRLPVATTGNLGSGAEQALSSRVVRLVIAGGLLGGLEAMATAQPSYSRQQNMALQPLQVRGWFDGGDEQVKGVHEGGCVSRGWSKAGLDSRPLRQASAPRTLWANCSKRVSRNLPAPCPALPWLQDADAALAELAAALPVDVMPGAQDVANVSLPQQPLHRCLFPAAGRYASLTRATNPHQFTLEGLTFLGTSGQNVDDMAKYAQFPGMCYVPNVFI